jgi:gliding motility-associated-like protein
LFADPVGNTVLLGWSGGLCNEELEPWQRADGFHDIYRRLDSQEWEPTACETGVPEGLGYELIASVQGLVTTSYVDEDLLSYGATYCYRVVMRLGDGSESLASDEVCATIIKDVPVMTHADVVTTDENGEVYVGWSPPTDMDVEVFPLPYTYRVLRGVVEFDEIAIGVTDTSFVDLGVDTRYSSLGYKVEAWCVTSEGPAKVGESLPARTPFLSLVPNDNRIELSVSAVVPWINSRYFIERKTLDEVEFSPYDTTDVPLYVDSGLTNTQQYCYRVITEGRYDSEYIENPLLNRSQEACAKPFDFTAPCPPVLSVDADCPLEIDLISWGGAHDCADDVMGYVLYWAPFEGDTLREYAVFDYEEGWGLDSTFTFNEGGSEGTIAGCFAVTALDSLLVGPTGELRRNESELSNIVCVDNCPFYFLPNVFTPNKDMLNDVFRSFQWKFIESIDLVIYNRWGIEVFKTTDPDINWDGRHFESGEVLPDGVYFYTLVANTIRLEGIIPDKFAGEIQILGSRSSIVE